MYVESLKRARPRAAVIAEDASDLILEDLERFEVSPSEDTPITAVSTWSKGQPPPLPDRRDS